MMNTREPFSKDPRHDAGADAGGASQWSPAPGIGQGAQGAAADLRDGVSLGAVLALLLRRKLLFLIPAIVVTSAFAVAALLMPRRYRAEAIVASVSSPAPGQSEAVAPELDVERQLASMSAVLFRPASLERMMRDVKLVPSTGEPISERQRELVRARIVIRVAGEKTYALGFEDRDRDRAVLAASRLAGDLVATTRAERQQRAEAMAGFLAAQLPALAARVQEQQRAMAEYQERHLDEIPDQVPMTMKLLENVQARLLSIATASADDEGRRASLRRELLDLESQGVSDRPRRSSDAQSRLDRLRATQADIKRRFGDQHPELAKLAEDIEEQEGKVSAAKRNPEYSPLQLRYMQLGPDLEAVDERLARNGAERDSLQRQIALYQARIEAAPRHQMAMKAMAHDLEETQAQYRSIQDRLRDARLAESFGRTAQGDVFRLIEAPRAPAAPVAPARARIVLLGLFVGLCAGGLAAFVAEHMDRSYRSVEDVQTGMGLPVLAAIPRVHGAGGHNGDGWHTGITLLDEPAGFAAEQYRILAARLARRRGIRRSVRLLVTSPLGGDGKTTTAINLSLALAEIVPEDVLLVDADLSRSMVHKVLRLPAGDGLRQLLEDPGGDPADYVSRHHGISILEAGRFSQATRMALASPAASQVFHQIRQRFAYVVVDAPPVLAVADSLVLEHLVDGCLLVVRARRTPRDMVRRAMEMLDATRLAGVVLNDVPDESRAYGYPYGAEVERKRLSAGTGAP